MHLAADNTDFLEALFDMHMNKIIGACLHTNILKNMLWYRSHGIKPRINYSKAKKYPVFTKNRNTTEPTDVRLSAEQWTVEIVKRMTILHSFARFVSPYGGELLPFAVNSFSLKTKNERICVVWSLHTESILNRARYSVEIGRKKWNTNVSLSSIIYLTTFCFLSLRLFV